MSLSTNERHSSTKDQAYHILNKTLFAARWRQPGVVVLRPDERPHDVRARRDGGGPDLGRRGGPGQPGELGLSALQESEADRGGDGGTHQAEFSTSMSRSGPRNC